MAANPYPNLGWNPVPGMPSEVNALRQKVASAAAALRSCHTQLDRLIGESSYWEGDAAKAFRDSIEGELPTYIKNAARSLEKASAQLGKWDGHLTSHRDLAQKYDDVAAEKKSAIASAKDHHAQSEQNPDLKLAGQQFPTQEEADAATARLRSAERSLNEAASALNKANAEYDDVIAKARALETTHEDDAEEVAKSLDDATDKLAPKEPGWLSKAVDAIWDGIKATGDFLLEHAGTIGAIAGLLALFPTPLTPLFAGIAVVASAASMGSNLADAKFRSDLLGGGSGMDMFSAWASVAGDTVGMIPGGKALGMAAKEVSEGVGMAGRMGVAVSNAEKIGAFTREVVPAFSKTAADDVAESWRLAGESTGGSGKLMGAISAGGLNVAANMVSSAESLGFVPDDGGEHNAAESTKAAATMRDIAELVGWV
ncbi:putative T7SS-secreted protein [Streptomyces sp. NPDC046805]|uniref:putative T7SS-secreted protein n=1 Tax=Streptomyces sp. NPDC046805 TaxID=3155134 RepID=UPI00340671C5